MSNSKPRAPPLKDFKDEIFQSRLSAKYEEMYYLYNSIYHNEDMFNQFLDMIFSFYKNRSDSLKQLDNKRLQDPKWFCKNDSIGIQIYADKFAGNLRGIETKLDYLQELGVKFVYALPFLDSPPGKSDGGFAVSDYRKVRPDLGTIEDLQHLIKTLHNRNMCLCMNFIIHHTSDEHEWAKRAKKGEIEFQNRYYFFDSWHIPNKFDSYGTMGHFFGDIAPDNFTYVPECQKIVMTTFYPFQWDVNFRNPIVFQETLSNVLFLMNLGVDMLLFNGTPNMWKKPGTSCRMLKQTYVINYLIFSAMQIVCPGVAVWLDLKRHKKRDSEETSIKLDETGVKLDEKMCESSDTNEDKMTNKVDGKEKSQTVNNNENIDLNKDQNNEKNNISNDHIGKSDQKDYCVKDKNAYEWLNDESESENEKEFVITESGVITADAHEGTIKRSESRTIWYNDVEEEEDYIDFDESIEIGNIHLNSGFVSRLWASLALCDVRSIAFSINAMCNRFAGSAYFTRVQSHDDINWGLGFDVESNSFLGKGLCNSDGFQGDIISLYRYLNDYYRGAIPGSFSRGVSFGEELITGKGRTCGRTASLLGLEMYLEEERIIKNKLKKKETYKLMNKLKNVQQNIQESINRILLLHSVSASMPSLFFIYYGDELGKMNDYCAVLDPCMNNDSRYLLRGVFNWENTKVLENDKDSYQYRIFHGIKAIIKARLNCPFFTENIKTVFIRSFSQNQYFDDKKDENEKNKKYEVDEGILIFKRIRNDNNDYLLFIFNFCKYQKHICIPKSDVIGRFRDMITGQLFEQVNEFNIKGYGSLWLEPITDYNK